jgi:hypothetical protein
MSRRLTVVVVAVVAAEAVSLSASSLAVVMQSNGPAL